MKIINSKIFRTLCYVFLIGIVCGIISYFLIDNSLFNSYVINYINSFNSFSYLNGFINSVYYNYLYLIILFFIGILFFLSFLIPCFTYFRGVFNGILFVCLIVLFKVKGFLIVLFLLFPCILINEFIFILFSYYSISFSIKVFNVFRSNNSINIRSFCKNYFYRLLFLSLILFLSILFEVYISSNLINFVV